MTASGPSDRPPGQIWLFATGEHECSYLPDRPARTIFVDPDYPVDNHHYSALIRQGMRRSGRYIYRPGCPTCSACQSLRVPVETFTPRRRQRRCWRRNADLAVHEQPPVYRDEHFRLYREYLADRHPGSGMEDADPDEYMGFLTAPWADTRFVEFRSDGRLLGIAVTDRIADGLSAVYTFFHPGESERGLGTFAILWQLETCRQRGLDHVYLGYWIAQCRKMRYKAEFQPCQVYARNEWQYLAH